MVPLAVVTVTGSVEMLATCALTGLEAAFHLMCSARPEAEVSVVISPEVHAALKDRPAASVIKLNP